MWIIFTVIDLVTLFGQIGAEGWVMIIGAIGTVLVGVGYGIKWLIIFFFDRKEKSEKRIDRFYEQQEEKVKRVESQNAKLFEELEKERRNQVELSRQLREVNTRMEMTRMKLATILESGKGALVIATNESIILKVSPEITPILHWLPEELEGEHIDVLIPKRLRKRHNGAIDRVMHGHGSMSGAPRRIDAPGLMKSGQERDLTLFTSWFKVREGEYLMSALIYKRLAFDGVEVDLNKTDEGPMKGLGQLPEEKTPPPI